MSRHATRLLLAVGTAFPLLVGTVAVPRLASLGQVGERAGAVRPASGAPPLAARVAPLEVSPPPPLQPAAPAHAAERPSAAAHPAPAPARTYTVQPGDELRQLAAQQGVSIASILALNDVENPDHLRVGQTLRFP